VVFGSAPPPAGLANGLGGGLVTARLPATGHVGAGVEIEDDRLPSEGGELDQIAILVGQLEVRGFVACLEHRRRRLSHEQRVVGGAAHGSALERAAAPWRIRFAPAVVPSPSGRPPGSGNGTSQIAFSSAKRTIPEVLLRSISGWIRARTRAHGY